MATAAAAVVAVAQQRMLSHFMSQNAVSAADAVTFEPDRRMQRRQFERMIGAGVFQVTDDGKYWLNVPAYNQWRSRARKRVGIVVGVLAAVGALAGLLT